MAKAWRVRRQVTVPRYSPVNSEQLQLDLFPDEPWGGWSCRALTRVRSLLFLRPEPPRHEVYVDPAQCLLWPESVRPPRGKRPQPTAGASLLLPLKAGAKTRRAAQRHFWEEE